MVFIMGVIGFAIGAKIPLAMYTTVPFTPDIRHAKVAQGCGMMEVL